MKKELIIKIMLSIIIVLASLCFVTYGAFLTFAKDAPFVVIFFGLSSLLYGATSIVHLISIHLKKNIISLKVVNYLGVMFLAGYFLASLDVGTISGLEWVGIFIVAFLIYAISQSFKRLGAYYNVA